MSETAIERTEILSDPENTRILITLVVSVILLFSAHIVPFVTNIVSLARTDEVSADERIGISVSSMVFAVIRLIFALVLRKNPIIHTVLTLLSIVAHSTILVEDIEFKQVGYIIDLISVVLSFLVLNSGTVENFLRNNVVLTIAYLLALGINLTSIIGTATATPSESDPETVFQPLFVPFGLAIVTLLLGVIRGYQGWLLQQNIIVTLILTVISVIANIFIVADFPLKLPFYITDAVTVVISAFITSVSIRE